MRTRASSPTDRAVPGDGVSLHARDWGGSGQAVVLLHGLASNARIWDGVASRLAGAGLRVVALDQRGHGASDQPASGYDFASVGRDLSAALAALGIERPVLAGHSWGANVGLQFAADRPGSLAGLALVDGALLGVAEWAGATREEARRRMAPPRFAVPLADWLARAGRFDAGGPGGPPGGRPAPRAAGPGGGQPVAALPADRLAPRHRHGAAGRARRPARLRRARRRRLGQGGRP